MYDTEIWEAETIQAFNKLFHPTIKCITLWDWMEMKQQN